MNERSRLILNLALTYWDLRTGMSGTRLSEAMQIEHELKATSEERAEAIEIADSLEEYFS